MSALNTLALAAALLLAAQAIAPYKPPPKMERVALHAIPDASIHAHVRRYL